MASPRLSTAGRVFETATGDRGGGFSLIEVIIAVGIFAVAVAAILGLLPSLARQAAEARETLIAQRLPEAVRVEMQRLAASGFDGFAGRVPVMAAPLQNGYMLVADRFGARLHSVGSPPDAASTIPPAERFFLIEAWRFDRAPLAYDSSGAVLATYLRISWPYSHPGADQPTLLADRSQFTFTVALNR